MSKSPQLPDLHDTRGKCRRVIERVKDRMTAAVGDEYHIIPAMPVNQIRGHIYTTDEETRGVYTLADAAWSNQTAGTQARIRDLATAAYNALHGRHLKIRIGNRPAYPWDWAANHLRTAPRPLLNADGSGPLYDHLMAAGNRILDIPLVDDVVAVDVHLCAASDGEPGADWEDQEADVLSQLAGDGLCGSPAAAGTISWLIHTSLAPSHPVPPAGRADMAEFTEEVDWFAPVMARAVRVVTHRQAGDGPDAAEPVETWMAALSVSTINRRDTPGPTPPWMSACLHAPFPVQLVVSGQILHPRDVAPLFAKRAEWQNDQIVHHAEHQKRAADSVYETFAEARGLADSFANGEAEAFVQFVGRLVVTGTTYRECMDRVRFLRNMYRDDVHITLTLARDQVTAISELCPGVREITHGYQRCAPVSMLAAGVPNTTGVVGQRTGMYFGYTSGSLARRSVFFDPWWPAGPDGQSAPIYPVLGDPGAGRSTFGMRLIQECILTGDYLVGIDPAGEWTTAAQLVGAPGRVAIADLSADTEQVAGILAIRRLIPDPHRDSYRTADGTFNLSGYEAARQKVHSDRVLLAQDSLRQLVDDDTWSDPARRNALKDAAGMCDGDLWAAIDWLGRPDEQRDTDQRTGKVTVTDAGGCEGNRRLARELTAAAYGPARVLFPTRTAGHNVDHTSILDAQIVIITMQGMQFPAPGSDQAHWTSDERAAALIMRLAAFLARRLIEVRPRRTRKILIVDEASWLANWSYGTAWIASFVRHLRRWKCALFIMTQHPEDLHRLDPEGNTFACGGFVGATEQLEVAEQSLRVIRAAAGLGSVVQNLSWVKTRMGRVKQPGEFLWVDAERRCERVRLDIEPFPVLAEAADTTTDDVEPTPAAPPVVAFEKDDPYAAAV